MIATTDNQQAHFIDIAEELDSLYDDSDRNFILWYLLGNFRAQLAEEKKKHEYEAAKTVQGYAVRRMIQDHMKAIEEIRDVLQEEIF